MLLAGAAISGVKGPLVPFCADLYFSSRVGGTTVHFVAYVSEQWQGCYSPEQRGSVMRSPIDIDHAHSRAIRQEIGERLQQYMRVEPELPASIRKHVNGLGESRKIGTLQSFLTWNHGFRGRAKRGREP